MSFEIFWGDSCHRYYQWYYVRFFVPSRFSVFFVLVVCIFLFFLYNIITIIIIFLLFPPTFYSGGWQLQTGSLQLFIIIIIIIIIISTRQLARDMCLQVSSDEMFNFCEILRCDGAFSIL